MLAGKLVEGRELSPPYERRWMRLERELVPLRRQGRGTDAAERGCVGGGKKDESKGTREG